jgi:hypothetical protein
MIFIVLTGLATLGTLGATVYEGFARRSVPWGFVGCLSLLALLFVSSLLVFA